MENTLKKMLAILLPPGSPATSPSNRTKRHDHCAGLSKISPSLWKSQIERTYTLMTKFKCLVIQNDLLNNPFIQVAYLGVHIAEYLVDSQVH